MKKILLLTFLLCQFSIFAQLSWEGGITPTESQPATLLFDATGTPLEDYTGIIYAHTGATINNTSHWTNVIGDWGNNSVQPALTPVSGNIYSLEMTPSIKGFYSNPSGTITAIDIVLRSADGSSQSTDLNILIDSVVNELTLTSPLEELTIVDSGTQITISATTTVISDFSLKANGSEIDTASSTTNYGFDFIVKEDTDFILEANDGSQILSKSFSARLTPLNPVPTGLLDGINLDPNDNTKATLVLYAPGKSTVHIIGDFNNWQEDATYLMNQDTARDRFWLELTGLTPQSNHMFQYLVDSQLRIADPYSTVILDEFNDQYIESVTYPNLPSYPTGLTNHAVTLLRTGDSDYNWQVTNFQRPKKTDLVIYELLIRDFDALHSFDAVKARLDYLETLGVNAIEFMPLNEFDGNLSWGYNPSFHMALDKHYGTAEAFKQLIDECHKRGIAVLVDVVYNHASGQNPYYRMWNTENGGYNGQATEDNPFFNATPKHAYNVFNDFNHQSTATKQYVERTVKYWIEEYNVDGFRWDLTKGFTQNCSENDGGCTDNLQPDRIEILKEYADYQWETDSDFYIIFEHLGGISEEKQWADYRADEGKGIMLWNNLNHDYAALMDGNANISNLSYKVKGFDGPSAVSYMESHDEERLMVDASNVNEYLERLESFGAFFFTVPGPKMIWQFGELGYDVSIDFNGRTGEKPILWEYFEDPKRRAVYETWSKIIDLKINEPIFETETFTTNLMDAGKAVHLSYDGATANDIQYITIIGNFGTSTMSINPEFQTTGTWYNLLENNAPIQVDNVSTTIELAPGEYRIYGDKPYIDANDLDSDGVTNNNDLCANTPFGTTVDANGCEIFTLPVTNFSIQTGSETCSNSNNGTVTISADLNLNYGISITGNGMDIQDTFTTIYSAENLETGTYEACITIKNQSGYEQCFSISITEPEDISVASKIDKTKGTVSLNMGGSDSYYITLNGSTIQTFLSNIDLELQPGANTIEVNGEKDCQGEFKDTIYFHNRIQAYPNPVKDILDVYLGNSTSEKTIQLYSLLGKLVYEYIGYENNIKISTSNLTKGVYILTINDKIENNQLKIVKQ
ncbi:alpha-amylase family glycosyl hydrolase [Flavisericum labens]|uniref:alpha-amylase family glycosyl hydrolase n=1 Tax=Flavisericum labens TaxID=3377112 RepID=UPI00387B5455